MNYDINNYVNDIAKGEYAQGRIDILDELDEFASRIDIEKAGAWTILCAISGLRLGKTVDELVAKDNKLQEEFDDERRKKGIIK